jgi:hypothetical protein
MADTKLILGGVAFQGFEIPDAIKGFGGRHHINKHVLVGGQRVLDTMGPDPDDITWSGNFRGPNALSRALAVDAMRQSGAQVALSWGGLFYMVVVSAFAPNYRKRYEIPYSITCMVSEVQGRSGGIAGIGGLLGVAGVAGLGSIAGIGGIASSISSLINSDLASLVEFGLDLTGLEIPDLADLADLAGLTDLAELGGDIANLVDLGSDIADLGSDLADVVEGVL